MFVSKLIVIYPGKPIDSFKPEDENDEELIRQLSEQNEISKENKSNETGELKKKKKSKKQEQNKKTSKSSDKEEDIDHDEDNKLNDKETVKALDEFKSSTIYKVENDVDIHNKKEINYSIKKDQTKVQGIPFEDVRKQRNKISFNLDIVFYISLAMLSLYIFSTRVNITPLRIIEYMLPREYNVFKSILSFLFSS
ncbi:hypothetical protein WA158_002534 [Blastocystis sp. Blastoise]